MPMRRLWLAVPIALCACAGTMVRAPKQIPANGIVECTDTTEIPTAALLGAVVSAGALAYGLIDIEGAVENGGLIWLPAAAGLGVDLLFTSALGYSYADECRNAKRRGAEIVRRKQAQVDARAEAGTLWKRAAAAARADDCATVRELDPQIRKLDVEFHTVVFARDAAIARCLAKRE